MTIMPYNTRRKSLSLPSLGIQLPNGSRAHRSNSKTAAQSDEVALPPAKRMKRSHEDGSLSPTSPRPDTTRLATAHTPPPSPGKRGVRKIDTEGINDDIVIAVIEQLEKTGNRPHLIKDLATVLASSNQSIAHSANAPALLSMRLAQYLRRPCWTPLSPCPLAKELIPVHPRKVFFYLTTQPRMSLPENSDDIIAPEIKRLTPSISDPSVEEDDHDRTRMSLSPEVELYSPELDHGSPMPATPGDNFSARSSLNPDGTQEVGRSRHNRAPSLPLEADEKGFTETATAVRAQGMSLHNPTVQPSIEAEKKDEMSPEMRQKKDQEELFGHLHSGLHIQDQKMVASSPMIQANSKHPRSVQLDPLVIDEVEMGIAGWTLMSPEKIGFEELEYMFEEY